MLAHDLGVLREKSALEAISHDPPPVRRALTRIGRPLVDLIPEPQAVRNYRQLADHLRGLIGTGVLGPGDLLPTAVDLARHLGLAKSTVHRAITALGQDGAISRTGHRWSVAPSAPREPEALAAEA
jgi:DNA-binding transcriptional ArsR family regulator